MQATIPIFIPSKGRAGATKTDKLMRQASLPYCFVVEPQEKQKYLSTGSFVLTLDKNDQGISYARNWILQHARKIGYNGIWMLDDDISEFGQVIEKKSVTSDASVLAKSLNQLKKFGPASLYFLELRQFAWTKAEVSRDKIAMQCVYFDLENCKNLDYDLNLNIREDYDLSFQAILKGKGTLRTNKYYYNICAMKSQEGGMTDWYNEETEKKETYKLCHKWPKLVKPIKKNGRIDVKINWSYLK